MPLVEDAAQSVGVRHSSGAYLGTLGDVGTFSLSSPKIISTGQASHPFIGVRLQSLTPQLTKEINATSNLCTVPELNGVLVIEVVEDSPAAKAGIKPCDLIRDVNGSAVNDPSEVQLAVDRGQVGQAMPLIVERDGEQQTLEVVPEELPRRG